jgi:hypothetical protein
MRGEGSSEFDNLYSYCWWEMKALGKILSLRDELAAIECLAIAEALERLDESRPTWDELSRQRRLCAEHGNWVQHLRSIANDWSPSVSESQDRERLVMAQACLRLAIVDLATRAFIFAHGMPPQALGDLVPGCLKRLPNDPVAGAPFRYRAIADSYLVYGVGVDGDDDNGRPTASLHLDEDGDLTVGALIDSIRPR